MTNPSLRQLDIFAQMVAAGSLTRCAQTLGVSSAVIERDMASLEMRLGYRLFDDIRGAARLTRAGRRTAQAMTLLARLNPSTILRPTPSGGFPLAVDEMRWQLEFLRDMGR